MCRSICLPSVAFETTGAEFRSSRVSHTKEVRSHGNIKYLCIKVQYVLAKKAYDIYASKCSTFSQKKAHDSAPRNGWFHCFHNSADTKQFHGFQISTPTLCAELLLYAVPVWCIHTLFYHTTIVSAGILYFFLLWAIQKKVAKKSTQNGPQPTFSPSLTPLNKEGRGRSNPFCSSASSVSLATMVRAASQHESQPARVTAEGGAVDREAEGSAGGYTDAPAASPAPSGGWVAVCCRLAEGGFHNTCPASRYVWKNRVRIVEREHTMYKKYGQAVAAVESLLHGCTTGAPRRDYRTTRH